MGGCLYLQPLNSLISPCTLGYCRPPCCWWEVNCHLCLFSQLWTISHTVFVQVICLMYIWIVLMCTWYILSLLFLFPPILVYELVFRLCYCRTKILWRISKYLSYNLHSCYLKSLPICTGGEIRHYHSAPPRLQVPLCCHLAAWGVLMHLTHSLHLSTAPKAHVGWRLHLHPLI